MYYLALKTRSFSKNLAAAIAAIVEQLVANNEVAIILVGLIDPAAARNAIAVVGTI